MKAERKKLKFQVEGGKIVKSCSWGHKREYIQGKDGRTPLRQRRAPSPSLIRGEEAMVV